MNKKIVTKKLHKGAIIDFLYNEEYEEILYSDRACSTAFEDADLNADITVYAKKKD